MQGTPSYLNMTSHTLLAGDSIVAASVNGPYRMLLSFSAATRLQFKQAIDTGMLNDGLQSFISRINYFFSTYAVLCFITALMLNRLVVMSSLRSSAPMIKLPNTAKIILHSMTTLLLTVCFVLITSSTYLNRPYYLLTTEEGSQRVEVNKMPTLSSIHNLDSSLKLTFVSIALSHFIETLLTVTSHSTPLEESDFTIFELSVQFYSITNGLLLDSNTTNGNEIQISKFTSEISTLYIRDSLIDCLLGVAGRILIHLVELFNIRKYRLIGSSIISVVHMTYLLKRIFNNGLFSLPILILFRHLPKLFSTLYVCVSIECYYLAVFIRGKFNSRSDLKFNLFMSNWWTHLNCTGEQDYPMVIAKFALLLSNDLNNIKMGLNNEYPNINLPNEMNPTFLKLVSPYNNEILTIPDDSTLLSDNILLNNNNLTNGNGNSILLTYAPNERLFPRKNFYNAFSATIGFIKFPFIKLFGKNSTKNKDTNFNSKKHSKSSKNKRSKKDRSATPSSREGTPSDLNDLITENNYSSFLIRPFSENSKVEVDPNLFLLPDNDTSEDYTLIDKKEEEQQQEDDDEELLSQHEDDQLELQKEVVDLLIPTDNDPTWLSSILTYLNFSKSRTTRTQFAQLYPNAVIQSVLLQNFYSHAHSKDDERKTTTHSNSSEDDPEMDWDIETCCVVCKMNKRNIILWPCKCLALCEDCRISLGLRRFDKCVCCRSKVNGYSKIHIV
ncbi:hypothetical protein TBLA_0B09320 [Henningerozyma blattae CBS 6284]|uniref:RING-type domain-containing protein n=1 Tax=Henningerozyma blattae (strain ATCC 34711 / CBS 6284 / DSM 70876 / NBRC 10599 / NRRL Y-10934 / UCD 77-7) TaxID=1071380 RepID=I2H047_HENB6|nr:hypothetical protein TBLA_0B09320 [Tetrapisispora blattae CBS 6284]CCH59749.1 hypothetical protein TBLA_0B09320 [Tetrapisispora blattae CBS 6284]